MNIGVCEHYKMLRKAYFKPYELRYNSYYKIKEELLIYT